MEKIIDYRTDKNKLVGQAGRKVLVGGCFDILHIGHIRYLTQAKSRGDFLIVALESDEYIKEIKGRSPIHDQGQRAVVLSALAVVDIVILLPRLRTYKDYLNLVQLIKPEIIAITQGDPQIENKAKQSRQVGAKVITVTNLINVSTKEIIKKIKDN